MQPSIRQGRHRMTMPRPMSSGIATHRMPSEIGSGYCMPPPRTSVRAPKQRTSWITPVWRRRPPLGWQGQRHRQHQQPSRPVMLRGEEDGVEAAAARSSARGSRNRPDRPGVWTRTFMSGTWGGSGGSRWSPWAGYPLSRTLSSSPSAWAPSCASSGRTMTGTTIGRSCGICGSGWRTNSWQPSLTSVAVGAAKVQAEAWWGLSAYIYASSA
mmetsp:Transcript_57571/g.123783  ORF Transcript_57571/g.123783 Transcript_57571/m.123783 type:complete len:212 (+) Transcript_57571:632-1267(+)